MPIDSRIVWDENERKDGSIRVFGSLQCTMCNNTFVREEVAVNKEKVWTVKEQISNEIGQHRHA